MRATTLLLLVLFSFGQVAAKDFQRVTIIDYSANCFKKYVYDADDGYIVDVDHTAYVIFLNNERTLRLKVEDQSTVYDRIDANAVISYSCNTLDELTQDLVIAINSGTETVFIKEKGKYYEVSFAEFSIDNASFCSSFAPPHHSLVFQYNEIYDPLQPLPAAAYDAFDYGTRHYYFGSEQEKTQDKYVYLRIYRDVCANRPFGLAKPLSQPSNTTLDEPSNPLRFADEYPSNKDQVVINNKVMRTCQHPVQVEHLKGIGVIQKSYEEKGKIYTTRLVSIDGVPLEEYLKYKALEGDAYAVKSPNTEPVNWELKGMKPVSLLPKRLPKTTTNTSAKPTLQPTNVEKGGTAPQVVEILEYQPSGTKPTLNVSTEGIKNTNLGNKKVHIVKEGETLYSISKKYGLSVLTLKEKNSLESNTIFIDQTLLIE